MFDICCDTFLRQINKLQYVYVMMGHLPSLLYPPSFLFKKYPPWLQVCFLPYMTSCLLSAICLTYFHLIFMFQSPHLLIVPGHTWICPAGWGTCCSNQCAISEMWNIPRTCAQLANNQVFAWGGRAWGLWEQFWFQEP